MHGASGPVSPSVRGAGGRVPPPPVVPPYAVLSSPLSSPGPAGHHSAAAAQSPAPAGAPARQDAGSHNVGKLVSSGVSPVDSPLVLGSGAAEEANPRFRPTMEDCYSIHTDNKDSAFFGVYDGHGGVLVAQFAQQRLYENLRSQLSTSSRPVPESLEHAYLATDAQIAKMGVPTCCGSTAVTVLVRREGAVRKIYAANAGDARAVLCKLNSQNGLAEVVSLSLDHKPTDATERQRILAAGGSVFRGRVMGVLAVSRALGDHSLKPMVSATPYLAQNEVGLKERAILILFCDGVSNVLTDKELAEYVVGVHNSLSPQGVPGIKLPSASYSFSMPASGAAGGSSPAAPRSTNSVMSLGRVSVLSTRGVGKPGSNLDKPAAPADGPEFAQVLANSIVAEAMRRGTRDNVTVVTALL